LSQTATPARSPRSTPIPATFRRLAPLAAALALAALVPAGEADASGYLRFQRGGRATGQAGAMTARVADPSAVYYNPAAIVYTEGLELQAGLDFNNATDEYSSVTAGGISADHSIQFPAHVYLTWHAEAASPWALGIGVDTPWWYRADFDPVFFPGRFRNRVVDVALWEVHPVVAYQLEGGWSLGGGLRYVVGSFEQGLNERLQIAGTGGQLFPAETFLDADGDVDGFGFDVAADYRSNLWGFAVVYRSGVDAEGSGRFRRTVRDGPVDPVAEAALRDLLVSRGIDQGLELPPELASGIWFAPYPELRLELDVVLTSWSEFTQTLDTGAAGVPSNVQRAGWDDVVSIRLGLEGDVTDALSLSGGVALEPSPVPGARVDPAFFRGDATVYSIGLSYAFPQLSFDLGYSLHEHDDVTVLAQEPFAPNVRGTYASDDQVWAVSARWRF